MPDPGTFDLWITDRLAFHTVPPKTGNTGDFDRWVTDRVTWQEYVAAAATAGVAPIMNYLRRRRA